MKETGIIMSGDHPKKILDSTKTMTRRVIKIPKYGRIKDGYVCKDGYFYNNKGYVQICYDLSGCADWKSLYCPYGQVGDRLWVRETYLSHCDARGRDYLVTYCADGESRNYITTSEHSRPKDGKHPSIHLPRWASRIDRIIALLRVERLRDISEADAKAEGGYTIDEFIKLYLKINHLPEEANPWNWVIGW